MAAQAQAAAGDLQLASRASGTTGAKADGGSSGPRLSGDGRLVAFATTATDLDPADRDAAVSDVYVRDLRSGVTTLVSRASGPAGEKGNGASLSPAISADGRYVAFLSQATNLSADRIDGDIYEVFVRDLQRDATTLVSRSSAGGPADAGCAAPAISGDGRVVAFESEATNLDPADADELTDVYARDLAAGTTALVSGPGPEAPRTGASTQPAISAGGTVVAFSSTVAGLDPADPDPLADVFARDLRTGALTLVSRADGAAGDKGDDASDSPALSGDGKVVAFSSAATNLDPLDRDAVPDVVVRNLALGTTAVASVADGPTGAKGDADSLAPAISQTGRFVAFTSLSALDSADADTLPDVYEREVVGARTRLLSRAAGVQGVKGDGASDAPSLSADARFAAFASAAANLHPDDADALTDVYVRDVLGTVAPLAPAPPRAPVAVTVPGRFPVAPASCPVDGTVTVLTDGGDRLAGGIRRGHPPRPARRRRPARARRPRLPVRRAGRRPALRGTGERPAGGRRRSRRAERRGRRRPDQRPRRPPHTRPRALRRRATRHRARRPAGTSSPGTASASCGRPAGTMRKRTPAATSEPRGPPGNLRHHPISRQFHLTATRRPSWRPTASAPPSSSAMRSRPPRSRTARS